MSDSPRNPIMQYKLGGYQPRSTQYASRVSPQPVVTPVSATMPQVQPAISPPPIPAPILVPPAPPKVEPPAPMVQRPFVQPVQAIASRPGTVQRVMDPMFQPAVKPLVKLQVTPTVAPIAQAPAPPRAEQPEIIEQEYIFDDINTDTEDKQRGGFARMAISFGMLLLLIGSGAAGWTYRTQLMSVASGVKQRIASPEDVLASTKTQGGATIQAIDFDEDELENYRVAPDAPRIVRIPELMVESRIIEVKFDAETGLEIPTNVYDVGWINSTTRPGQQGVMVLNGLGMGINDNAVFREINTLNTGSTIEIENGAGDKFRYAVRDVQLFENGNLDMDKVMSPFEQGKNSLNIMACAGSAVNPNSVCEKLYVVFTTEL